MKMPAGEQQAAAASGAAEISRTCCIELMAPKPIPQIATPNAITGRWPAPKLQTDRPASSSEVASSEVLKAPQPSTMRVAVRMPISPQIPYNAKIAAAASGLAPVNCPSSGARKVKTANCPEICSVVISSSTTSRLRASPVQVERSTGVP